MYFQNLTLMEKFLGMYKDDGKEKITEPLKG
jgi:hypothetical protein